MRFHKKIILVDLRMWKERLNRDIDYFYVAAGLTDAAEAEVSKLRAQIPMTALVAALTSSPSEGASP